MLLDRACANTELLGPLPPVEHVWAALDELQRHPDSAGILRDVLLHPQLGVWISHAIRTIIAKGGHQPLIWLEVGQIHCITFAVAVRARHSMNTLLPVRGGGILLPTLGLARFPGMCKPTVATAITEHGTTSLLVGSKKILLPSDLARDGEGWWSLRRITAQSDGNALEAPLDDIDPFRDLADPVPPLRLSTATFDEWKTLVEEAWRILNSCVPETAMAMSAGLRSIAPLPDSRDGSIRSASTGDGFGAVLVTRPPNAVLLAESLTHEFHHVKLGGLLHLHELYEDDGVDRYYAPWRDDPRPLSGLFQGVYAFLGITAFWRSRCRSGSEPADHFEYAYLRRQVWMALRALTKSRALTALGDRFVRGMTSRLQPWMTERLLPAACRSWWAVADHRIGWRIRNCRSDPAQVHALTQAWIRDNPTAKADGAPASNHRPWSRSRITLLRMRTSDPDRFLALQRRREHDVDVEFVGGNNATALASYREMVLDNVNDHHAWAGLALAALGSDRPMPWRHLLGQPELVKSVCHKLSRLGYEADPLAVAAWSEQHPA